MKQPNNAINMDGTLDTIVHYLIEEGKVARAHFQTWWALRNLAIPEFLPAMNKSEYVDFFHVSNAGHYKMIFVALSKIFDRDARASGFTSLKATLRAENRTALAEYVEAELSPLTPRVARIDTIRNQAVAHNQTGLIRTEIYEANGITPNEICDLIDKTCTVINHVARELGISEIIFESKRFEDATLALLKALQGNHNNALQATCENARP
jgi:hypothetical protein